MSTSDEPKPDENIRIEAGVLKNLDELDEKVAELKKIIKAGEPLTMGDTNLLSGILLAMRDADGAW